MSKKRERVQASPLGGRRSRRRLPACPTGWPRIPPGRIPRSGGAAPVARRPSCPRRSRQPLGARGSEGPACVGIRGGPKPRAPPAGCRGLQASAGASRSSIGGPETLYDDSALQPRGEAIAFQPPSVPSREARVQGYPHPRATAQLCNCQGMGASCQVGLRSTSGGRWSACRAGCQCGAVEAWPRPQDFELLCHLRHASLSGEPKPPTFHIRVMT